jgi:hypothetical protein
MNLDFDLSIEQQFQLRQMTDEAKNLTKEEAIALLLQVSELAMRRQSVIKSLVREVCGGLA